jgi:hypothetical protein
MQKLFLVIAFFCTNLLNSQSGFPHRRDLPEGFFSLYFDGTGSDWIWLVVVFVNLMLLCVLIFWTIRRGGRHS